MSQEKLPWSPTQIAVISLVLTPFMGGILHALNYERLGAPARTRVSLFSNLITGVAFLLGGGLLLALFASAYFYKSQERLFETHCAALGGRTASLLWPIVLTIGTGLVLLTGLGLLLMTAR